MQVQCLEGSGLSQSQAFVRAIFLLLGQLIAELVNFQAVLLLLRLRMQKLLRGGEVFEHQLQRLLQLELGLATFHQVFIINTGVLPTVHE